MLLLMLLPSLFSSVLPLMDHASPKELHTLQSITRMLQLLDYQENDSRHIHHVMSNCSFLKFCNVFLAIVARHHEALAAAPSYAYDSIAITVSSCKDPDVCYHVLEPCQQDSSDKTLGI